MTYAKDKIVAQKMYENLETRKEGKKGTSSVAERCLLFPTWWTDEDPPERAAGHTYGSQGKDKMLELPFSLEASMGDLQVKLIREELALQD